MGHFSSSAQCYWIRGAGLVHRQAGELTAYSAVPPEGWPAASTAQATGRVGTTLHGLQLFLHGLFSGVGAVLSPCCCTGFTLVAVSGAHSLVVVPDLLVAAASLAMERGPQGPQASVAAEHGLSGCGPRLWNTGSVFVAHGLSSSEARGIFLDQALNSCLLHWQDSLP